MQTQEIFAGQLSTTMMCPVLMAFGPYAFFALWSFHRFYNRCPHRDADSRSQLHQLMALSEYDALVHWHRPVVRLHLVRDFPAALDQMLTVFQQALQRFQPGI